MEENDCIEDWYLLGRKLFEGEPRFIRSFDGEYVPQCLEVFFKGDGKNPTFYKYATLAAFQVLFDKKILEVREFGKGSKRMSGWVLTKAGRNRIGRFDREGNPMPLRTGHSYDLGSFSRRLPVTGLLRNIK